MRYTRVIHICMCTFKLLFEYSHVHTGARFILYTKLTCVLDTAGIRLSWPIPTTELFLLSFKHEYGVLTS